MCGQQHAPATRTTSGWDFKAMPAARDRPARMARLCGLRVMCSVRGRRLSLRLQQPMAENTCRTLTEVDLQSSIYSRVGCDSRTTCHARRWPPLRHGPWVHNACMGGGTHVGVVHTIIWSSKGPQASVTLTSRSQHTDRSQAAAHMRATWPSS